MTVEIKMRRKRNIVLTVAAFLFLPPLISCAAATNYRVGSTFAHVSFTITKWMVFKEEGIFRDVSGTITFDPKSPGASKVEITVQAASIDTNNATRDGVLRSDDFFDVARYPTLTFSSTRVVSRDADTLEVTGDLSIHGVTRQITVPVKLLGLTTVQNVGELAGFETSFTIDRTDFGVLGARWSGGQLLLSKEVTIHLRIGGIHRRSCVVKRPCPARCTPLMGLVLCASLAQGARVLNAEEVRPPFLDHHLNRFPVCQLLS